MKFIDLSATIAPSPEGVPAYLRTDITYNSYAAGAAQAQAILKVPASVFRNSEGWATETITNLGTHDTTHVDAPRHYNSEIQGKPAAAIDELPLEWFYGDGVVLDMCHKADGDAMTSEDAKRELERIHYRLKPLDIVLVRTGRDQFYFQPDYIFRGCGVTAEATRWLYEQGIRVMGIDAWGWDAPLDRQAKEAMSTGQAGIFWAAHQVDLPYAHIERLVNLGGLPAHGFKVSCFPLKIKGGSAGPARIVAIVPE
jgi:kynurenine formamidase